MRNSFVGTQTLTEHIFIAVCVHRKTPQDTFKGSYITELLTENVSMYYVCHTAPAAPCTSRVISSISRTGRQWCD